jgi:hypothetical protein
MADRHDLEVKVIECLIEGLGFKKPLSRLESIKDCLRGLSTSSNGMEVKGESIYQDLHPDGGIRDRCRDLVLTCVDFTNGLDLLRTACKQNFSDSVIYAAFEQPLLLYAAEFKTQQEFVRNMNWPEADEHGEKLGWIDRLDDFILLNQVKQAVNIMSRPGESFFDSSPVVSILSSQSPQEIKDLLRELMKSKPACIEEFMRRLQDPRKPVAYNYLHILVEPDPGEGSDFNFVFKAELYAEGSQTYGSFDQLRNADGAWPAGTIDRDFPRILGQWLQEANQKSPSPVYVEIFLPHKLLAESPVLKIEIPCGNEWIPLDLGSCGRPIVLRSWDRALLAKSNAQGLLHSKWNKIHTGEARLHSISKSSQLEFNLFNPRLGRRDVAGILMLLDLPADHKQRDALFWMVIDSGIPIFAWWSCPQSQRLSEGLSKDEIDSRKNYLRECLQLSPDQNCNDDEFAAPQHLHSMEYAADCRLALASNEDCLSWIHNVMILHDHPARWPRSILYQQEAGGRLQSIF